MSSVVKNGELGSLCRPYRAPWSGQGKPRAKALGYSLAPLRGSGGVWLAGEGSSVSDRIRIRHLRCLPHSGLYGRTSVRPYKMLRNHV